MKTKLPDQKFFREKQKLFGNKTISYFNAKVPGNSKSFSVEEKNRIVIEC